MTTMKKTFSEVLSLLAVVLIILVSDLGLVKCSLQQSVSCSAADIVVNQASSGIGRSGIPVFLVEITNKCSSACTIRNVHLHCGEFSSDTLINPEIFERVAYDDCLVNNGAALAPGQVLSFMYSTSFMYPLSVSYLDIFCST